MIQQTPEAERFKQQMRDSLQHETLNSRAVTFARREVQETRPRHLKT